MLNYKRLIFWIVGVTIIAFMFIGGRLVTHLRPSRLVQKDALKTEVAQSPASITTPINEEQMINENQLGTPNELIPTQVSTDLEQSISNAILSFSPSGMPGYVAAGEGHITLQTVEKNGITYVHILERYTEFGFENDTLTEISGHANPALLSFQNDSAGNYILVEHIRAFKDEIDTRILELFPESEVKRFTPTEHEKNKLELDSQIEAYRKAYLNKTGRNTDVQITPEH